MKFFWSNVFPPIILVLNILAAALDIITGNYGWAAFAIFVSFFLGIAILKDL